MVVADTQYAGLESTPLYGRLVADTWMDPDLLEQLNTDPATVLRERGFHLPDGVQVRVVSRRLEPDTDRQIYVVLPSRDEPSFAEEKPKPEPRKTTRSFVSLREDEPVEDDPNQGPERPGLPGSGQPAPRP